MGQPKIATQADSSHEARLALAAQFVPAGARVIDLSGGGALRRHLPDGCTYKSVKPNSKLGACDVVVLLDLLERIEDAEALFARLSLGAKNVVLNYRPRDLAEGPASNDRLGFYDLARLFDRYGFRTVSTASLPNGEVMLRLTAVEPAVEAPPVSIAVLAANESFGDKLSLQMLGTLLPGEADVHYLTPGRMGEARSQYDLAIIGAGNALTPAMLGDATLDLIENAKTSLGLFGTQHRELNARADIERLIGGLDTWYARHEDDLLLYGRGNVVHLGDWLIDEFPLGMASDHEPLSVGPNELRTLGLDAIATIRRHRSVTTTDRAALLCALTSADMAAWRDENLPAGPAEFRSLLLDIFGRSYPAGEFFLIDRDAVQRYRARVHANIAALRERIAAACAVTAASAAA
jgi:hypothetical protein